MIGLVIFILAVYGVCVLLVEYDGPRNMFLRLRDKYPKSALKCVVCTSVWVSLLLFVPVLLEFGYYLTPLAAIGAVILLEKA